MTASSPRLEGLRVLALESRRATEFASLVTAYGGRPIVAPALREVPIESNAQALEFAAALLRGEWDLVVLLTGVGTRALLGALEHRYARSEIVAALGRTKIVARGPKPLAVLRELGLATWLTVPEPNTWHELLAALDARSAERPLRGARVAVQEYGVSNPDLLGGLRARGAAVTPVPVYRWALPEDVEPLKQAVQGLVDGEVDVIVFTAAVQVVHLWQVVAGMGLEADVRRGLQRVAIASIGPSTTDELKRYGLAVDLTASRPKMGFLVREVAEQSAALLRIRRGTVDRRPAP